MRQSGWFVLHPASFFVQIDRTERYYSLVSWKSRHFFPSLWHRPCVGETKGWLPPHHSIP